MQVSSNTLFHFTNSISNIENILIKKFHLTYCNEKFHLGDYPFDENIPMISFCDLPLGLIKTHIEKYGCYGIGMKKEWGIKNKLNPVLYLEKNSVITNEVGLTFKLLYDLISEVDDIRTSLTDESKQKLTSLRSEIVKGSNYYMTVMRFIKNYEGDLIRSGKTFKNYRFYDEKEWRYIPSYSDKRLRPHLNHQEYKKYRGNSSKKPLIDDCKLDFTAAEIKYLIVKSEKDIPKLIRTIKSVDNLTKSPNEADVLMSKILTVDQIKDDV